MTTPQTSHSASLSASQAFVQQRLDAILARPDSWGPPVAVELQVILLMEFWHVARGAPQELVDLTNERFGRFIGTRLPGSCFNLAGRLDLAQKANEQFILILKDFVQSEQSLV